MTDKDSARQQITQLVEKFRDTPQSQRNSFSEQETREYFILPLFRALGWDTENPAEFSAEEQISRGFVDFGFYLSHVPAFYLETKKASEKLENPKHMKQAINYAFLKGVTWAVLTDFQQLMVFNAEWEETDPTRARFLNLQCEQYASDQFDDLWLLSKASFQERDIDRVAERFGKKSRKQPVTEVLFKQLTVWRRELFEQMRTYGRTLWSTDPRAVDNAVQKFLDRMIFIRTVEDRGVEPNQLRSLVRQATNQTLYKNLLKLFRDLDSVYNSNLFAESETDRMEVHDPDLIREIVEGLYGDKQGFVNYDFNAITADVLGAVYEQYLGFKAQDPTGEQALDPRKQEKRKKQGIYYTPQFVVRYIVRHTLGQLLNPLPVFGEGPGVGLPVHGRELPSPEFVHSLRILDPACGSGSFLIEAFDVLDRWLAINGDETDRNFPRRRRLRILQENLYGVDLDEQAVEVTRLNLMLRAAIERDKLPYLTHIQHGNSLIDDPDVAGEAAFKWEERFPAVFAGGSRSLWFVTFVTHNSRVSERMVTYGIQAGNPLVFTPEEQILMAEHIAEACRKYQIPVVAWNVLPDHVHMVIGAEDEATLNEYIRKVKGYSAYAFRRASDSDSGLKPTVSNTSTISVVERGHVWARKFNRQPITDQNALNQIIEYVRHNHEKHIEKWGSGLIELWESGIPDSGLKPTVSKPLAHIIQSICVPPEQAAHIPGGFDVVIGNPPYVRQESLGAGFKDFAAAHYNTYAGTNDLYVYFIEKEFALLKSGGRFGMIVANKWMRANYGKSLRQWLKQQPLEEIIDFGDLPVFQDATAYPCILIAAAPANKGLESLAQPDANALDSVPDSGLKPTAINNTLHATQVKTLDFPDLHTYTSQHRYPINRYSLEDEGWSLARTNAAALMAKLRIAGVPLGEYVKDKIYRGVLTGLNEAFVIDAVTRDRLIQADPNSAELIKPFLAGRDVKRYKTLNTDSYVIFTRRGTKIQNYPAIAEYLTHFQQRLTPKPDDWSGGDWAGRKAGTYSWYEIQDSVDYYLEFEKPKIVYAEIATVGQFTLDTSNLYCDTTAYILGTSSEYLLGILNSRLWTFMFAQVSSQIRGGFLRWKRQYMSPLPIRAINFDDPADTARHDRMVSLVETMLRLKQQHAVAQAALSDDRHRLAEQIEQTDRQIDRLVYELYGLTDEEIKLVEGN